jgi:putative ABC transport system permease protein
MAAYEDLALDPGLVRGLRGGESVSDRFASLRAKGFTDTEPGGAHRMDDLYQDLRSSLRASWRRPHAALLAAIAAMALGIGAGVAIFSVVDAVLLRPLPYPHPDELVTVWNHFTTLGLPRVPLSEPELYDYRERNRSLQDIAVFSVGQGNLTGGDEPERVDLAAVSPSLFAILGLQPSRGRVFVEGEDGPESPRLAVVSDAFWRERRGADPDIVGRDVVLNGNRTTIVGVMPPAFRYPENVDVWVPLRLDRANLSARGNHYLATLSRLKRGVDPGRAQKEMSAIALQMQRDFADSYPNDSGFGVRLTPFQEELTGDVRPALLVVLAAVGLVLLIACANVANLQLGRALARSREMALRRALGEPRARLVRRLLAESLMVAFTGGGLGVLLAAVAVRALTRIDPTAIPRAGDVALDARVLLVAVALALVSGLSIGLVPAAQASRLNVTESLKEDGEKSVGGRRRRRVRRLLVVAETALAMVLVIGAGLLVRTFGELRRVDPGFDPAHTLTLQIALPTKTYSDRQASAFFETIVDAVKALPGVRHAGVVDCLPLGGCSISGSYYVEGHMPAAGSIPPEADTRFVSPDYFRAMGIPLQQGRNFGASDREVGAPGVVIVDEDLARLTWPGRNPLGERLKFGKGADVPWQTVVGVVRHVDNVSLDTASREQVYIPLSVAPLFPVNDAFLVIRADDDPAALAGPVREQVRRLDADLPIFDVRTMSDRLGDSLALRRFSMSLMMSLAVLALLLAAVGTYSVVSYSVTERNREIGVRMALGAGRRDILGMVVGQGLAMTLAGAAAGLALAYVATRLAGSLLYGISATDAATYAATSLLLVATAAGASYFPARRATRVSPMSVLGRE